MMDTLDVLKAALQEFRQLQARDAQYKDAHKEIVVLLTNAIAREEGKRA